MDQKVLMEKIEKNNPRSIAEHIGDLRRKLLLAVAAFSLGAVSAHYFHKEIISFILSFTGGQDLIFLSPLEPLLFIFKIDCLAGLVISFPVILWCLLSFLSPAFSKKTSFRIYLFSLSSLLLIVLGLLYAFYSIIPLSLKFLFSITIPGIHNQISAQSYLSFFLSQAIIVILVFQVPIAVVSGVYLKIFKVRDLAKKRRHAYLLSAVALAIITPTTDAFSLLVVFIPCLVIFEISLIIGLIIERLRSRKNNNLSIVK